MELWASATDYQNATSTAAIISTRPNNKSYGKLGCLLSRKPGLRAFRPVINKPLRTRGVEAVNPIAQRLAAHAADPRGRPSVHSVSNPCQRQKPPALIDVLRPAGQPAQRLRRIVFSQSDRRRHGANPPAPT